MSFEEYKKIIDKIFEKLVTEGKIGTENKPSVEVARQKINEMLEKDKSLSEDKLNKKLNMIVLTKGNALTRFIYSVSNENIFEGIFIGIKEVYFPYSKKYSIFNSLSDEEKKIYEAKGMVKYNENKEPILIENKKELDKNFSIGTVYGILNNGELFILTLFNESAVKSKYIIGKKVKFNAKESGKTDYKLLSTNTIITESSYSTDFDFNKLPLEKLNNIRDSLTNINTENSNNWYIIKGFSSLAGKTQSGMTRISIYTSEDTLFGTIKQNLIDNKLISLPEENEYYLNIVSNIRNLSNNNEQKSTFEINGMIKINQPKTEKIDIVEDFFN